MNQTLNILTGAGVIGGDFDWRRCAEYLLRLNFRIRNDAMNSPSQSIYKTLSPLTKSIGNGKVNRPITMPIEADIIATDIAAENGISVNEFGRRAFVHYAAFLKSMKAVALKAAMQTREVTLIAFAIFIPILSLKGGMIARRPSRLSGGRIVGVRVVRREVGAA